ncbi:MAG TPA: DUF5985 family protein [Candidatus Sulfotelmatobacter sp.]|jgi:hypothetical protein|nr:DUF5985 family protein [Candidatus Sulfotelmatobacter sp.]
MMESIVYTLGALTSFSCGILLLRGYFRGRKKLLLWSGLCFLGLGANNALIFVDLVVLPQVDLYMVRLYTSLIAMALLLYGLVWESN